MPQFESRKRFDYAKILSGLRLGLWGLFKKIVIADNLGGIADSIFTSNETLSSLTVLIGSVIFAFQIYCDFSGYSDIAVGVSKMLGYDLKKNFTTPYFAHSFTNFWRRWHISLSTWFRDYVYIPLGGSRAAPLKTNLNILATFLLSGLWHGANVTFLIWGGLHGALLVMEKKINLTLRQYIAIPIVFLITSVLWIPFRAENLSHLGELTTALFFNFHFGSGWMAHFTSVYPEPKLLALGIVFILFLLIEVKIGTGDFAEWITQKRKWSRLTIYYFLVMAIVLLGNFDVKPNFIYFQF